MRAAYLFCAVTLLAADARAQEDRGAYFGASYGNLGYENVDRDYGVYSYSGTGDQRRLIGGFRLNRRLSVEASRIDATNIDSSITTYYGDAWNDAETQWPDEEIYRIDAEVEVLAVRAVGTIPFNRVRLVGGAGYYSATVGGTFSVDTVGGNFGWAYGPNPLGSEPRIFDDLDHSGLTLAGGVQLDFGKGLSLRAEAEYFFTPSDVTLYATSVGVLYRLGWKRTGATGTTLSAASPRSITKGR